MTEPILAFLAKYSIAILTGGGLFAWLIRLAGIDRKRHGAKGSEWGRRK